ncbi:MAG: cytochrome b/b6 domain-containing protein [Ferrovibrio sp.]|uniref:cytochrome b n=1 Tax=Pseudomonadota TaxID=1224 RepID=UPI002635CBF8|nr:MULTISPECIES: cytochrome b/b6 domain-containing protein [Pseudomonadota]MCW0232789.1 cytochrome b/b6 domain-containing protein [Ferrovibrio sp.]
MPDKSHRYSASMIVIHWLTALLVLGAWFTAEGGRKIAENPPLLHFSLGLAVLVLVLPRLVLRVAGRTPEADRQGWLAAAAKAGHGLLYLLLIGLPITGWYAASRMGVPVSFLGVELPAIASKVQSRPGLIAELHENAGTFILILAGLHALMAVWHQFVLRDGTLQRMSLR